MNPISSRILQIMVVKSQELGFDQFLCFLYFLVPAILAEIILQKAQVPRTYFEN